MKENKTLESIGKHPFIFLIMINILIIILVFMTK